MTYQEFCKNILPMVQAGADGKEIQVKFSCSDHWCEMDEDDKWDMSCEYRIKPMAIMIGGMEVPEPCHEPLDNGQRYYVPDLAYSEDFRVIVWSDTVHDTRRLLNGIVHLNSDDAIAHSKALVSLTSRVEE